MSAGPDAGAVLARHEGELMALPGVVGVAVGERDGEPRLLVMVERRTPSIEEGIPSSIEGVPIEVRETGTFRSVDRAGSTP